MMHKLIVKVRVSLAETVHTDPTLKFMYCTSIRIVDCSHQIKHVSH
jgi:hypothetical protein